MSFESNRTCTRDFGKRPATPSTPASSPRYSTTLFVALPMCLARCAKTFPSPSQTTAPYPAGPGFPREPPSALMMTIAGSFTDRTPRCEPGCGHTPRSAIHRLLLRYAIGRYHACSVLTGILDSDGIEAPRPTAQHVYDSSH